MPCFQLTLRRISEPRFCRVRPPFLLLRLSAALESRLPRLLFRHSDMPCLFHYDHLVKLLNVAFYSRRMFYLSGSDGVAVLTSGTCRVLCFGRSTFYLLRFQRSVLVTVISEVSFIGQLLISNPPVFGSNASAAPPVPLNCSHSHFSNRGKATGFS